MNKQHKPLKEKGAVLFSLFVLFVSRLDNGCHCVGCVFVYFICFCLFVYIYHVRVCPLSAYMCLFCIWDGCLWFVLQGYVYIRVCILYICVYTVCVWPQRSSFSPNATKVSLSSRILLKRALRVYKHIWLEVYFSQARQVFLQSLCSQRDRMLANNCFSSQSKYYLFCWRLIC